MPRERRSKGSSRGEAKKDEKNDGLRTLVQKRFTKDVFAAAGEMNNGGWMVLVVDRAAMRVLSTSVGMYDVMEKHVTVVEDINKKRAPFKDMNVIYMLACTEDSVNQLIADFEKPLYGPAAYVYFLGRISEKQLKKIKECKKLIRRLKGLAEINVDFLPKEMSAFHMDLRTAFSPIYVRNKRSKIENRMADKLVTLCATLNELPHIRFAEQSATAGALAKTFHVKMENFARANSSFWYHGDSKHNTKERATLLILDRKDDCLTPLMHDFTYQAMVNDLLPIDEDRIQYVPDDAKADYYDDDDDDDFDDEDDDRRPTKPRKGAVDILLNESDNVWVELRGKHIVKVIETLSTRIREMVNSDTAYSSKSTGKQMTLSQMANALKALPEYKEVMSKLSQHMHLAHQCMDKLQSQGLYDLSTLEQVLATGKDVEGKKAKLSDLVNESEYRLKKMKKSTDRLRLLLILIVSQGGIRSTDKDRLFRAARLNSDQQKVLDNLGNYLDIPIFSEDGVSFAKKRSMLGSLFRESASSVGDIDEESEFENSRYVPPMKAILQAIVQNELSFTEYPSVVPMPQEAGGSAGAAAVQSARKQVVGSARKGGSASKWQKSSTVKAKTAGPTTYQGGRLIIFVVGGMSFPELRVAREVMAKENKEIIAGSTCFMNPTEFIEDIQRMA